MHQKTQEWCRDGFNHGMVTQYAQECMDSILADWVDEFIRPRLAPRIIKMCKELITSCYCCG